MPRNAQRIASKSLSYYMKSAGTLLQIVAILTSCMIEKKNDAPKSLTHRDYKRLKVTE